MDVQHTTCTYERLPEDEPSVWKHLEHKKILKIIDLEKVNFVVLYCVIKCIIFIAVHPCKAPTFFYKYFPFSTLNIIPAIFDNHLPTTDVIHNLSK